MSGVVGISRIPGHGIDVVTSGESFRFAAASGGVFPLGLGRQAVFMLGSSRNPFGVSHCILPADTHHRMVIGLEKTWGTPARTSIFPPGVTVIDVAAASFLGLGAVAGLIDEYFKVAPGDIELADKEITDADLMHRHLDMVTIAETIPHMVATCRDFNELGSGEGLLTHRFGCC